MKKAAVALYGVGDPAPEPDLPPGWASASVLELCDIIRGVSYAKGEASTEPAKNRVPILRANNITSHLEFDDLQYVPKHRVDPEQLMRVDDVVVAMSSGSKAVVGKAAQLLEPWSGAFGAFCGVLRPTPRIEPRYFGYYFQTREYRNAISEASAGTNINNLKRQYFADLEFPMAPLPEQRRIVAALDGLLPRVRAVRDRLIRVRAALKRFRRAVLAAACSGRLTKEWREGRPGDTSVTQLLKDAQRFVGQQKFVRRRVVPAIGIGPVDLELPEQWDSAPLRLFAVVLSGQTPKGIGRFLSSRGRFPWLKVGDMNVKGNERLMSVVDAWLSPENIESLGLRPLPKGAIIFPKRGGAIATNKKRVLERESCVDLNTMGLIPFVPMSDYLWWWFLSVDLGGLSDGSNVPQINHPDIERITVPVPPLTEQHEIVRRIEALFNLADGIEACVAAASARADRLTQAILAKAFRGELVPQDPADEPAVVLLERIRLDRALKERQPSPRRRSLRASKVAKERPAAPNESTRHRHPARGIS